MSFPIMIPVDTKRASVYASVGRRKQERKVFSIRIDPDVWKAAREKGLNISQICEKALKLAVLQKGVEKP